MTAASPTATLSSPDTIALFDQYVIPNYRRYPISLVRGEGSRVWDAEGRSYLDLFPGWGCNVLGYCPPRVVQALQEQAANLIHVPNTWHIEQQGRFAEALCTRAFGKAFFCNSGAEANEGAIKLARLHTPPEKYKIITFENGFHGRTLAAVTATAQPKYHEGLGPLVAGFQYAKMGDLDGVTEMVDEETCAIMIEPVQGEGGINIPQTEFLQGLRELCDRNGMLLIFDEVQTGMARTGSWFGYQQYDVQPDIMTLAKGIAAGVACGALICTDEVAPSLRPGMHASTFGGNPLAMAAGLATIESIEADNLIDNVHERATQARAALDQLASELPIIRDVRIRGMMIGIDLTIPSTPAVGLCMDRGLLLNATHDTVVRLLPALNVSAEEMNQGLTILGEVLREMAAEAS